MKRRDYLLTAGAAIGIAGCMDHDPVTALHTQSNTGTGKTYADLETERLVTGKSLIGEVPWAHIAVANGTDFDQGKLDLSIKFYDETQSLCLQESHSIEIFPAMTTWIAYHPVTTPAKDNVASVEADIEQAETRTSLISPDAVQIEQSELQTTAGAGLTLTGTLYTGNYTGRIRLIGLIYDSEDQFRGTAVTTSDRLNSQDQWEFQASNALIRTPEGQPNPTSYDLRLDSITE